MQQKNTAAVLFHATWFGTLAGTIPRTSPKPAQKIHPKAMLRSLLLEKRPHDPMTHSVVFAKLGEKKTGAAWHQKRLHPMTHPLTHWVSEPHLLGAWQAPSLSLTAIRELFLAGCVRKVHPSIARHPQEIIPWWPPVPKKYWGEARRSPNILGNDPIDPWFQMYMYIYIYIGNWKMRDPQLFSTGFFLPLHWNSP